MQTLKQILANHWGKDDKMIDYCLKSTIYVESNDSYINVVDSKQQINKTIYYADTDYLTGGMAKDPGTSWKVFYNHNIRMNSPKSSLDEIKEKHTSIVLIPSYYRDSEGLKSWKVKKTYDVVETDEVATPEQVKLITETLESQSAKYEKRLANYFKRYNKHIRTSSYWAER